jgi:hypothetical protein
MSGQSIQTSFFNWDWLEKPYFKPLDKKITVSGLLDKELKERTKEWKKDIVDAIKAFNFKAKVSESLRALSEPKRIFSDPKLYAQIDVTKLGYTGLYYDTQEITTTVIATGNAQISDTISKQAPINFKNIFQQPPKIVPDQNIKSTIILRTSVSKETLETELTKIFS